jgi:hypothetical protein
MTVDGYCRCLSEIIELRLASTTLRRHPWQALSTNNIDMSSTESSGAPAEATATSPAPNAAPSFGSTRGSGLLRGKAKRPSAPAAATAASSDYTPTAIAVVSAPREYQNPFAPVETPAALTPDPSPVAVAKAEPVVANIEPASAPAAIEAPALTHSEPVATPAADEQAELNILEPEQQKIAPAQTWESEGFRPARESRHDRPQRDQARSEEPRREGRSERAPREERAPIDPASIPAKFLYVRPGYNYVPTPSNYGGAPRSRESSPAAAQSHVAPVAAAPQKSGGFFGWVKSLFGGSAAAPAPAEIRQGEHRSGDRHRGGRGRSSGGGGDGQRRRSRGGRGRSQYRGENRGGGDHGSPPAT